MAVARPAADHDRLPWLDSRVRRRRRDPRLLLIVLFALAALATAAGLSFWFGQRSLDEAGLAEGWPVEEQAEQAVSRELPPAIIGPPADNLAPGPVAAPQVEPPPPQASPRLALREDPGSAARRPEPRREAASRRPPPAARKTPAPASRRTVRTRYSGYWPTPATAVRLGRMIQIGTFSNPRRANDAWLKTLRSYPQTRGLPRISSSYKARNGRTYHRVQIMTTAPAQSHWLCRKMRADGRRCAVLGSRS